MLLLIVCCDGSELGCNSKYKSSLKIDLSRSKLSIARSGREFIIGIANGPAKHAVVHINPSLWFAKSSNDVNGT